ncbi:unnamed protein product [Rotaria sp. Silwood2]|nr:unnamed protein product [Rotaria sp. Silwood2]
MNLNNLPDEVLFYSNDKFDQFIESCLGLDEMNLLKIQSIKNNRTLIKVPDIFSVLSIKCKELADLKDRLCFIDEDNNNIIIKTGVKMGFDDLIAVLKEKNCKYIKKTKKSKFSSSSSTTNSSISNTSSLNTTDSNITDSSLISTPTTATNVMSINDHIQVIVNSIEKYSINTFRNIILKHDDDYMIHLNQSDTRIDVHIKCGCKSTMKLAFRFHTQSFQLSQYFKHLKHSRCSMMKKRRQELTKNNNLSYDINHNNTLSSIEDEINFYEENMNTLNENSQITTNKYFFLYLAVMTSWEQDLLPFLDELPSYSERACFIADDSSYIVRPGIRSNIEQFIELLKNHYNAAAAPNQIKGVNNCMCGLVDINNGNTEYQLKSFVHVFVNNLMKNINRSSNNYQFDPTVNKFASAFSILAGHQAYEFVRINLPGSLPSITTLKNYNQNINLHLNEGEFRFDSLKKYLDLVDSNHVFVCEDSTSVVGSVSYDSKTNSFVGFSPKLVNGLPLVNQFQTHDFNELQQWFQDIGKSKLINANLVEPLLNKSSSSTHSRSYIISAYGTDNKYSGLNLFLIITFIKADTDIFVRLYYGWVLTFSYRMWCNQLEKTYSRQEKDNRFITRAAWLSIEINIHCLTSIIILVLQGLLPSSTLNTHLFSSQPCETTFRSARALSEGNNVECPLKFPIHHKNQREERTASTINLSSSSTTINDIEKIIIKAYHEAEKIMNTLELLQILKENDLDDIKKLNSFVFQQLHLKSSIDYCYFNEVDLQDSADDSNNNIQNDTENFETNVEVEGLDSDDDNPDSYHFTTSKETFQGMKIFDEIDPTKKNNYFHIMINNKPKYLHKQTAARLLTTSKNCLSSDRLSRVQQTRKQK